MPSGSRGEVSTTSGLPHGQRCATDRIARGGRPSWAPTTARSASASRPPRFTWLSRLPARSPTAAGSTSCWLAARDSPSPLDGLDRGLVAGPDDDVHRLAGHRELQPRRAPAAGCTRGRPICASWSRAARQLALVVVAAAAAAPDDRRCGWRSSGAPARRGPRRAARPRHPGRASAAVSARARHRRRRCAARRARRPCRRAPRAGGRRRSASRWGARPGVVRPSASPPDESNRGNAAAPA